jgi:DNA-binding response OmpR family regulator
MFPEKARPQILYVEDHEDTQVLVSIILGKNNFDVTTTDSLVDGKQLLRTKHFDLYLLDRWLPDGDGLELAKTIRQSDPLTPIVFVSAVAFEHDRMESLEAGAQAYLVKPVNPTELLDVISDLVKFNPTASTNLSLSIAH